MLIVGEKLKMFVLSMYVNLDFFNYILMLWLNYIVVLKYNVLV